MKELDGKFSPVAYAAMRFVVAALYTCHGVQKVFGVLGGHPMPHGSLLALSGGQSCTRFSLCPRASKSCRTTGSIRRLSGSYSAGLIQGRSICHSAC